MQATYHATTLNLKAIAYASAWGFAAVMLLVAVSL